MSSEAEGTFIAGEEVPEALEDGAEGVVHELHDLGDAGVLVVVDEVRELVEREEVDAEEGPQVEALRHLRGDLARLEGGQFLQLALEVGRQLLPHRLRLPLVHLVVQVLEAVHQDVEAPHVLLVYHVLHVPNRLVQTLLLLLHPLAPRRLAPPEVLRIQTHIVQHLYHR